MLGLASFEDDDSQLVRKGLSTTSSRLSLTEQELRLVNGGLVSGRIYLIRDLRQDSFGLMTRMELEFLVYVMSMRVV